MEACRVEKRWRALKGMLCHHLSSGTVIQFSNVAKHMKALRVRVPLPGARRDFQAR